MSHLMQRFLHRQTYLQAVVHHMVNMKCKLLQLPLDLCQYVRVCNWLLSWRRKKMYWLFFIFPLELFSFLLLLPESKDAKIQVLSIENPVLSKAVLFKPGVGQNIVLHASPAGRNSTLLIPTFPFHSASFPPDPLSSLSWVRCGRCSALCGSAE